MTYTANRRTAWQERVALAVAFGLVFATCSFLAGCGGDEAETVEGSDVAEASSTVDGEALYRQACGSCHGANLEGTNLGPSHLSIVYERNHHPDEAFRRAIAQGVVAHHWNFGDMAAIPGLSDAEVEAIIEHVRARQAEEGFEPYPPEG